MSTRIQVDGNGDYFAEVKRQTGKGVGYYQRLAGPASLDECRQAVERYKNSLNRRTVEGE